MRGKLCKHVFKVLLPANSLPPKAAPSAGSCQAASHQDTGDSHVLRDEDLEAQHAGAGACHQHHVGDAGQGNQADGQHLAAEGGSRREEQKSAGEAAGPRKEGISPFI